MLHIIQYSKSYIIIKLFILGCTLEVHSLVRETTNLFNFGCDNSPEIQSIQIWNLQNSSKRFGEWVEYKKFVSEYFSFVKIEDRQNLVS